MQRQAGRTAAGLQEQIYAEQEAEAAGQLPKETIEALEAEHDRRLEKARRNCRIMRGSAIAFMSRRPRKLAKVSQFSVRRGGEWAKVQNAKLKPGEAVFIKRESGEIEAAGTIDSRGKPRGSGDTLMMQFRLEKQSATKALVKYHILNSAW